MQSQATKGVSEIVRNMTSEQFIDLVRARFSDPTNDEDSLRLSGEIDELSEILLKAAEPEMDVRHILTSSPQRLARQLNCVDSFAHHEFTEVTRVRKGSILYVEYGCLCGFTFTQGYEMAPHGKITGPYRYDFTEAHFRDLPGPTKVDVHTIPSIGLDDKLETDMDLEGGPY